MQEETQMATQSKPRVQAVRSSKPEKSPTEQEEADFLANVMVSVSTSLDAMNAEEREQAVADAERAVAHLQ